MKHLFLFLLFLLPVLLSAQDPLPANPRKLRLGYQTDGEGIVLYGSGVPSYTPTRYRSAFHYMDTTNNIYYQYNRIEAKWDTILAGAGAVADGVSVDNSTWSKIGGTDVQQALTKIDSALNNITVDGSQIQNKFEATTTTLTVSADTLERNQSYSIVVRNSTAGQQTKVVLPSLTTSLAGKSLSVIDSSKVTARTSIASTDTVDLYYNGYQVDEYILDRGERVEVKASEGVWHIVPNTTNRPKTLYDYWSLDEEFTLGSNYELRPVRDDVDSLFVIPLKNKVLRKPNLFGASITGLASRITIDGLDVVNTLEGDNVGVQGKKTARALVRTATDPGSVANVRMRLPVQYPLIVGRKYSLSFWAKVISPSTNGLSAISVSGWVSNGTDTWETKNDIAYSDSTWQFFHVVGTYNSGGGTRRDLEIRFSGMAEGDSVLIDQWRFNIGESPADYYPSASSAEYNLDTIYAVYVPKEGSIFISDLVSTQEKSYAELINDALYDCKYKFGLDVCNTVVIDQGGTEITETIRVPEKISLISATPHNLSTTLYANINDSTKNVIEFWRDESGDSGYTEGQTLRGFNIVVQSPCRAVIETTKGADQIVENISILGEEASWSDSLFRYGLSTAAGVGPAGLDNTLTKITIEDAWEYAFYLDQTKLMVATDLRAVRSRSGIYHAGVDLYLFSPWIEKTYASGIVLRGAQYTVTDVYFESVGDSTEIGSPLKATEGVYCLDIANAVSASISDAVMTGNSAAEITTYIKARNSLVLFSNPRVNQSGALADLLDVDCTNNFVLLNVNYTEGIDDELLVCQSRVHTINSNISGVYGGYANRLNRTRLDQSYARNSYTEDVISISQIKADTAKYEVKTAIQAEGFNIIANSEPFYTTGNGWEDLAELIVADGTDSVDVPHPDIQKIAKLTFTTPATFNLYRYRYVFPGGSDTLQVGKRYIASCWVRPGDRAIERVAFQLSDNTIEYIATVSDTSGWERVFIEFFVEEAFSPNTRTHWVFYTNGAASSNYAYATGFQIIEIPAPLQGAGYEPEYLRTEGGQISDPTLAEVELLDTLHYTGLKMKIDSSQLVTVRDATGNLPTVGQIPVANADSTWSWGLSPAFDGGSLYITDADPDTLDFSASGGIYQQIQDLQATALDNFTSLSDSLIYGRSLARPFTLNFSVTVEGDTGSTFYNFEVKRNGTAITGCRVSEEYPSAGVEQNISGSCRVDLVDSDALTLEIMTPSASSQVIVRKANLTVH